MNGCNVHMSHDFIDWKWRYDLESEKKQVSKQKKIANLSINLAKETFKFRKKK